MFGDCVTILFDYSLDETRRYMLWAALKKGDAEEVSTSPAVAYEISVDAV